MDEQEYQDKLKVRTQLSLADKFRVLEHEFGLLIDLIAVKGGKQDLIEVGLLPPSEIKGGLGIE